VSVPGAGISEESTGGGGAVCCGHAAPAVPGTELSRAIAPQTAIKTMTARDRTIRTGEG
jgi:hypothetical protein